jgi:kinesin family protein 11
MKDIETQMQALDDFVGRARVQNAQHHNNQVQSLQELSTTVKTSYGNVGSHFNATYERLRDLGDEMSVRTSSLQESLEPLDSVLKQPLADLRSNIATTEFQEYRPTGATPQKTQYLYPTELPRTDAHEQLLAALRRPTSSSPTSKSSRPTASIVFHDIMEGVVSTTVPSASTASGTSAADGRPTTSSSLREVDTNITTRSLNVELQSSTTLISDVSKDTKELFRRSVTGAGKLPVMRSKKLTQQILPAGGIENVNILAQSTGRRRSPRTG